MKALMRLDSSTFLEKDVVEDWESLIWTERYSGNGEFELLSPKIPEMRALLPEGTLLAVDESREVMIVENREVEDAQATGAKLKVTGRTFETILECRGLRNGAAIVNSTRTSASAAILLIQKHLVDPDVAADDIPGVGATASGVSATLSSEVWKIEDTGDVYSKVNEILNGDALGLRNLRPTEAGGLLVLQVYDGFDRTSDSSATSKVILDHTAGHVKDPSYLWSIKDYRNIAYVNSPIGFRVVPAPGVSSSVSGFNRRVLQVDASDLTSPGDATVAAALIQRGRLELAKHNKQAMFSGQMANNSPYKYGTHYGLGDKITAKGMYGIKQDMMVTEFIRNWSSTGEYQEYPTLTTI